MRPAYRARSPARRAAVVVLTLSLAGGRPVAVVALEATITDIRAASAVLRAVLEVKEVFTPAFRKLIEDEATLYLRVDTELWEDRPAWDRLLGSSTRVVFRISRDRSTQQVALADPAGGVSLYPRYPQTLQLRLDVAPTDRIDDLKRYYVHALLRLATVRESDSDDVSEAVFGSDRESGGLAAIGRFVFRKAIEITDYLQSASAETRSRKLTGRQLKGG